MKNAIIVHGKPSREEYYDPTAISPSNAHWLAWLQGQLLKNDVWAATPEIPNAFQPYYPLWQKEFERFDVTEDTILVGHSCGAGFLVRWLSEHPNVKVGKVILVAPSLGKDWVEDDFFEFTIDPNLIARTKGLVIFNSNDDRPGIQDAVKVLRSSITDITYKEFDGYGHFTYGRMKTSAFPELLTEALS